MDRVPGWIYAILGLFALVFGFVFGRRRPGRSAYQERKLRRLDRHRADVVEVEAKTADKVRRIEDVYAEERQRLREELARLDKLDEKELAREINEEFQ